VQEAENAASAFVFVPPGTFNESVTIDTEGLTLLGSSRATVINGGGSQALTIDNTNVTVESISVQTTPDGSFGGADAYHINATGTDSKIISCHSKQSDGFGINCEADDVLISNCTILDTDSFAVLLTGTRCVLTSSILKGNAGANTSNTDNCIITNNIMDTEDGAVNLNDNDHLLGGNRIMSNGSQGVEISFDCTDVIVFNNRVSGATTDIDDNGTGTVLDGNLTGASN